MFFNIFAAKVIKEAEEYDNLEKIEESDKEELERLAYYSGLTDLLPKK